MAWRIIRDGGNGGAYQQSGDWIYGYGDEFPVLYQPSGARDVPPSNVLFDRRDLGKLYRYASGGWTETLGAGVDSRKNVKDYGATGNGGTVEDIAISEAIQDAKDGGSTGMPAGVVFFPPGEYVISTPIILPRTGVTPTHAVQLVGSGPRATRIRGSASFPTNRGLIEWDASVSTAAWHQSITNVGLLLPNVAGAKAIHYKPNDKSTGAACLAERLQIDLADILLEGSNQYHESAIRLEGNVSA